MKSFRLIFILATCTAVTFAADEKTSTPATPAPIAEYDRLVQEFMAERAKLVEARKELQAKTKKAKAEKDAASLKQNQGALEALQKDFGTRTADLVRRIKEKEAEKRGPKPASKSGS